MNEKRMKMKLLVEEFLETNVDTNRSLELNDEIIILSPDYKWVDYLYWSDDEYYFKDGKFNMEKFLNKVFSATPIFKNLETMSLVERRKEVKERIIKTVSFKSSNM